MNNTTKSAADAAVVATKIAAKETAKQLAAKQAEAEQKTSEKAKAAADEATKEAAEHPMLSEEDAAPAKAKNDGSSFRTLMLIGVAAAFCAAFTPHMTKPSVANKLAEANHPVAVPPQWLPVLLASAPSPSLPPPPVLTLNVTYYDFSVHADGNKHSDSHPDFERGCEEASAGEEPTFFPCEGQTGLVEAMLGDDGRHRAWHCACGILYHAHDHLAVHHYLLTHYVYATFTPRTESN